MSTTAHKPSVFEYTLPEFRNGWWDAYIRGWAASETLGQSEQGKPAPQGLEAMAYEAGVLAEMAASEEEMEGS